MRGLAPRPIMEELTRSADHRAAQRLRVGQRDVPHVWCIRPSCEGWATRSTRASRPTASGTSVHLLQGVERPAGDRHPGRGGARKPNVGPTPRSRIDRDHHGGRAGPVLAMAKFEMLPGCSSTGTTGGSTGQRGSMPGGSTTPWCRGRSCPRGTAIAPSARSPDALSILHALGYRSSTASTRPWRATVAAGR